MTLRCPGARWRILVHERYPKRRSDGTLYGREYHVTSDPMGPEKLLQIRQAAGLCGGEVPSVTVLAGTEFDELVLGSAVHIEQVGASSWFVDIGGLSMDVTIDRDGRPVRVFVREPEPVEGCTVRFEGDADREALAVDSWERSHLIDGLMVLIHQMELVPENDLSEMPRLQALLEKLMEPEP